jgi:hypothetical protein
VEFHFHHLSLFFLPHSTSLQSVTVSQRRNGRQYCNSFKQGEIQEKERRKEKANMKKRTGEKRKRKVWRERRRRQRGMRKKRKQT